MSPTSPDTLSDPPAMPARIHPRLIASALAAALLTLVLSMPHAGFMVVLVLLPLCLWLPYSAWVIVRRPAQRRLQTARVGIWLGAVLLILAVHGWRHVDTRRHADALATAIRTHTATHGHCPARLEDIGLSREQLRDRLGLAGYACENGQATFFYAATFVPFSVWIYDFARQHWRYRGD